jgi:hypothetical protein
MQAFAQFCGVPNGAVAHQNGTVSSAVVTLPSLLAGGTLHPDTRFVEISVENDDIRLTTNGTNPTSTLGRKVTADSSRVLSAAEAGQAKMIRVTTDAVVQINQYSE